MAPMRAATVPTSPALANVLEAAPVLAAPVADADEEGWPEADVGLDGVGEGLLPPPGALAPGAPGAEGLGMGFAEAPSIWAWTVELKVPLMPAML